MFITMYKIAIGTSTVVCRLNLENRVFESTMPIYVHPGLNLMQRICEFVEERLGDSCHSTHT